MLSKWHTVRSFEEEKQVMSNMDRMSMARTVFSFLLFLLYDEDADDDDDDDVVTLILNIF